MKRKFILCLILFILFYSQLIANETIYKIIHFYDEYSDSINEKMNIYSVSGEEYIHQVYPLGWSTDGKFAYISEWPGGNSWEFKLIIQNLITDEYIYESEPFDTYILYDSTIDEVEKLKEIYPNLLTPEFYYLYNQQSIEETLTKFNIIKIDKLDFHIFPYEIKDKIFDVKINELSAGDPGVTVDGFSPYNSYRYNVQIYNELGQSKIIHTEELGFADFLLDHQVIGCIKSPYEDRIVVLIGLFRWNYYYGNELLLKVIGSELNSGF